MIAVELCLDLGTSTAEEGPARHVPAPRREDIRATLAFAADTIALEEVVAVEDLSVKG